MNVKRYVRPIGKSCGHCRRRASVTAERVKPFGMRLSVAYCLEHFDEAERRLAA